MKKKKELEECQRLLQRLKKITTEYHERVARKRKILNDNEESLIEEAKKTVGRVNPYRSPGFIREKRPSMESSSGAEDGCGYYSKISPRLPPQYWGGTDEEPFKTPRSEASLYPLKVQRDAPLEDSEDKEKGYNREDFKRITVRKRTFNSKSAKK